MVVRRIQPAGGRDGYDDGGGNFYERGSLTSLDGFPIDSDMSEDAIQERARQAGGEDALYLLESNFVQVLVLRREGDFAEPDDLPRRGISPRATRAA